MIRWGNGVASPRSRRCSIRCLTQTSKTCRLSQLSAPLRTTKRSGHSCRLVTERSFAKRWFDSTFYLETLIGQWNPEAYFVLTHSIWAWSEYFCSNSVLRSVSYKTVLLMLFQPAIFERILASHFEQMRANNGELVAWLEYAIREQSLKCCPISWQTYHRVYYCLI